MWVISAAFAFTEEGERLFDEAAQWNTEAATYIEEYMPEMLASYPRPHATLEQIVRYFEQRDREANE